MTRILEYIGGKDNITSIGYCMTRLRITVKDKNCIDEEKMSEEAEVIKVQFKGGQLQIIFGPEVQKYYDELIKITGNSFAEKEEAKEAKGSLLDKITDFLAATIIPAIAAVSASGLIKGLLAVFVATKVLSETSDVYTTLSIIGDAPLYFLAVLVGFSAARKLKTNEYLGASIGLVLMYPTLAVGATEGLASLDFFGISIPYASYANTIIPTILGVIVLKYIYGFLKKYLPVTIELVITGPLAFAITCIITLAFLAPLGNYIGVYIAEAFSWLFNVAGPLAGLLLCAFFAPLVMTGMAYGTFPLVFQNLSVLGYDYMILPIMVYSNANQGIASIAAGMKLKEGKIKSNAFGAGITAVLGITEPAMYTVNIPCKKPFYAAMIGSGVAGFLSVLLMVKVFALAGGGITALPAFVSSDYANNFILGVLCLLAGMVVTFVITYLWMNESDTSIKSETNVGNLKKNKQPISIASVADGEVEDIKLVPDSSFAEEKLGRGVAIDDVSGKIYAPFHGVVSALFPTKHAIGLRSDEGIELLVHIGIDTVKLDGMYFSSHVKTGDTIHAGQLLLEYDYEAIKKEGYYPKAIVVMPNSSNYKQVNILETKQVRKDSVLFTVEV